MSRPSAADPNPWVDELVSQLRLAGAWYLYSYVPIVGGDGHPVDAPQADAVKDDVLEPFLVADWLGQKRALASWIPEALKKTISISDAGRLADLFARELVNKATHVAAHDIRAVIKVVAEAISVARSGLGKHEAAAPNARAKVAKPLLDVKAEVYWENWRSMADGLAAWLRMRPAFGRAASPDAGPLVNLAARCEGQALTLRKRNELASWVKILEGPKGPKDAALIAASAALFDECAAVLRAAAGDTAGNDPVHPRAAQLGRCIDDGIAAAPAGWPALWLARLPYDIGLSAAAAERFRSEYACRQPSPEQRNWVRQALADKPEMTVARVLVVRAAVGALDAAEVNDSGAWATLGRRIDDLLADTGVSASLLRDDSGEHPDAFEEPVLDQNARSVRVERTGILLTAGSELVFRQARLIRPVPPVRWRAALDALVAGLDRAEADPYLADLGRQVGQTVRGDDVRAWWHDAKIPERGTLWRMLHRASVLARYHPAFGPLALGALEGFATEGFRLCAPDEEPAKSAAVVDGPWFLADVPADSPLDGRHVGPFLLAPDGELFGPSVWFGVPRRGPTVSPAVAAATAAGPALARLKEIDAAWEGWPRYNALVPRLASDDGRAAAREALVLLRDRHRAGGDAAYLEAARQFREPAGPLHPDLDPTTLRPKRLTAVPPGVTVDWVVGNDLAGTPAADTPLGEPGDPAHWSVSLGDGPPAALADWWHLPRLDRPAPLVAWAARVRQLPLAPAADQAKAVDDAKANFVKWLRGSVGGDEFDAFANAAAGGGPELAWLAALEKAGWCRCYPALQPDGRPYWPAGAAPGRDVVHKFDADSEAGDVLAVSRYATTPAAAACTISRGALKPGSPLAHAVRLQSLAPALGLSSDLIDRLLAKAEGGADGGFEAELLDALAAADAQSAPAEPLDEALAAARGWLGRAGTRVLPDDFTFAERTAQVGPGVEACKRFAAAAPGQVVALAALGWADATGTVRRPARLAVSAGHKPRHYDELLAAAERAGPAAADLRRQVEAWPEKPSPSAVRSAAAALYMAVYDLPEGSPDRAGLTAAGFGTALERLLADEFGVRAFRPERLNQYPPDHVQAAQGQTAKSTSVKRVLRPGLQDGDGNLVLSALVEVN